MMKDTFLWEILVPTQMDRGNGPQYIKTKYHRVWDEKVRNISGGLTVLKPATGQWVSPTGNLFSERMIPVRIMCTRDQIDEIVEMTLEYYNQEAVMVYVVSNEVKVMRKNE